MIIDIAGRSAHRWATHDLDAGAAYAAASVFDANLQLLLDRAGVLMRTDADRIAGIFDDDFEIDDDDLESPAERADEQARAIEDVIKEVALLRAKVEAFRKKYRVGRKPSLGNSKPLEHHFVLMMKQMWRATTKTNAPKSKDGRFARFVIAAWSDLEFDAREGIDDTLASYCETL
ncbi:hypothetical protein [Bosea sp. 117]|uniref:hypothetical protein n=1 Tax=Bosea sp. 117 TaxID=1125973 RepID=UPI0004947575|nr:hypothetical protein [Bosea sp. 117]